MGREIELLDEHIEFLKRESNDIRSSLRVIVSMDFRWMIEKYGFVDEVRNYIIDHDAKALRRWLKHRHMDSMHCEYFTIDELREVGKQNGLKNVMTHSKMSLITLLTMKGVLKNVEKAN